MPQLMQRIHRVGEGGKHRLGRDRIEQIADLVVARGLCHPASILITMALIRIEDCCTNAPFAVFN